MRNAGSFAGRECLTGAGRWVARLASIGVLWSAICGTALAELPDGRAYEQVSPVEKNGNDAVGNRGAVQAAVNGDGITFISPSGIPGGEGAEEVPIYLSRRTEGGWKTEGLLPPPSFGPQAAVAGWTQDLAYVFDSARVSAAVGTGLVSRRSSDGDFEVVAPYTPNAGLPLTSHRIAGTSADGSKVFFEVTVTGGGLPVAGGATPAPGKPNLYVWNRDDGSLRLAGVLPDAACGVPPCAPPSGSFAGPYAWFKGTTPTTLGQSSAAAKYFVRDMHAVTPSGSVFFTAGATGQIYLRADAADPGAQTVQVSASQRAVPDPNGVKPTIFMGATDDGSRAFFTSCAKLTDDATAVSTSDERCDTEEQGADLYEYDVAGGALTDLTVDAEASDLLGADVKGVIGVGGQGSQAYVYFVANGVLAPGAAAGSCAGPPGELAGLCNLYLSHEGATTFVARLDATGGVDDGDSSNWKPTDTFNSGGGLKERTGRVSADGTTVLFRSQRQLTPYANGGTPELYRFQTGDLSLACVSCNPSEAAPEGPPTLQSAHPTALGGSPASVSLTRNLASDGDRVFFESRDKLLDADVNGDDGCPLINESGNLYPSCLDVYEWEVDGSGSCESSAVGGGCLYLLSTGASDHPSYFADASMTGDDASIFTRSQLVGQDRDELVDVYDARIGGGIPSQNPVPFPVCSGEAECRPAAIPPPPFGPPGSAVFTGPGNPRPVHRRHKKRRGHKHKRDKRSHHRGARKGSIRHAKGGAR